MSTLNIYEPEIIVNTNTRQVSVPETLYNVGVVSDDNAEMLKIRIPRYFDGNDLSTKKCSIIFNNAAKERGIYTVEDFDVDDNAILLYWHVSKFVTKKEGQVTFIIKFEIEVDERGKSYSWSTAPARLNVMKGLDENIAISESDTSLYRHLLSLIQSTDKQLAELEQRIVIIEGKLGGES